MARTVRRSPRPFPISFRRIRQRYAHLRQRAAAGAWPEEILAGLVETMLVEEWSVDPEGWEAARELALARSGLAPGRCPACGAPDADLAAGRAGLCPPCESRGWADDWDEAAPAG